MALTKELLKVLEDSEEPLPKRLKIADNAFKSAELPIQHREAILLKWLAKATETNESETWHLLLSWLTSQQIQDLSRNDITRDDVKNITNLIIEHTQHSNDMNWNTIIKCITALIENRNFQMFFKYDMESYCIFISSILYKIDDEDQLLNFISNEQLFNRNLICDDDFYKHFIQHSLVYLDHIVRKFSAKKEVFQEISKLVQRCIFHRNFKNFSAFLKMFDEKPSSTEKPSQLPKLLFKSLHDFYNADLKYVYKLLFHAYCASYSNNFEMIYKFFILIVETLSFDLASYFKLNKVKKFVNTKSSLDQSITILTELCHVLTENTNELNFKIKDVPFTELLQNLTLSIITLTKQPNEKVYEYLNYLVVIDPLIVEKIINEILIYIVLSNKETMNAQYEKFFVSIFEVFAKLHRISNLVSKMIPILKTALEGNFTLASGVLSFSGTCKDIHQLPTKHVIKDLLPAAVLNYFTQCITTLPSWQVMNLFKTLLFHLETAVSKDLPTTVEVKITHIEIISTLMCQFLSSVRIAEHTVQTMVVEKFVKAMEDLKETLGKFGTALVNVEHNPILMRAYLNICYTWGELYTMLAYYSINNEVVLQKTLDSDTSACNITYLHPYLTRDQWCLISQRITNFGETPCKLIMHKLYIQKLRAMMLFEESVGEEIISPIRISILSSIDDHWKDMVSNQLVLDQVISKAGNLRHISEIILQDLIESDNLQQLELFFDCKELINAMLYTSLYKLNKAFKRKQKRGQAPIRISLLSKIFPSINEDVFLTTNQNQEYLQELADDVFAKQLAVDAKDLNTNPVLVVNEKDVWDYLKVVTAIPVIQGDQSDTQQVLMMYFICMLLDLHRCNFDDTGLIDKCESIIIGLAQNYSGSFRFLIKPVETAQIVIDRFSRYLELFTFIAQSIFKNEEDLEHFKDGIEFLTKNIDQERYLQVATVVLNKSRKSKISAQSNNLLVEYQERLCKSITEVVKKQKVPNVVHLTEAFTLVLNYSLSKNSTEGVDELAPYIKEYIKEIINNSTRANQPIKGAILLFATIIRNKSKLKNVQEDIVMTAWNYCQNTNVDPKEYEEYSKLVVLNFEHIPNEQFSEIANGLLEFTAQTLNENKVEKFAEQLKIWNAIVRCHFNPIKTKVWQKILESLLFKTVVVYLMDEKASKRESIFEEVVKFETGIIQNVHLILTASLIESTLVTVSVIASNPTQNFVNTFTLSISLLEALLKFRKPILMDYLPSYLQRYRALLSRLCAKSNSDLKLEAHDIQQLSDCAHKLEKLTRSLVDCNRHLMRICPYLIADILKQYEKITLFQNVKIHLNNCLYSLISLCDQHAISYLMRILSTASTEMFKIIYENYKKYYKFTGKV